MLFLLDRRLPTHLRSLSPTPSSIVSLPISLYLSLYLSLSLSRSLSLFLYSFWISTLLDVSLTNTLLTSHLSFLFRSLSLLPSISLSLSV